jgi:hypothetical protein
MKLRHLASAASIGVALALAGPALADDDDDDDGDHGRPPSQCPPGFNPAEAPDHPLDVNDNGIVCVMTTPVGDVFVDDLDLTP